MKRKCAGCRALQAGQYGSECRLDYDIEEYNVSTLLKGYRPKEECPKPLTYVEYFAALRKKEMSSDGVK